MDKVYLIVLSYFILISNITNALKCRTGNEEDNEQYYKIMDDCKKRYTMQDNRNSDSDESVSSNEDNFDRRSMSNGRFNFDSGRNSMNGMRNQQGQRGRDWNNRSLSDIYNGRNMNRRMGMGRDYEDQRYNHRNQNWHFTNGGNFDRRFDDQYGGRGYDQQDQSCVTQCFFNELNLVDQRGFPDRSAVNSILLEDIQDPELQDFVEEAVVQCFHYLNLEGKQNKCQYSQHLLSCLIEKGEERCDDWMSNYKK